MSLDRYKEKRDFKITPEPAGKPVKSPARLRYVIQKHAASHLHYDFRLELGGVLLSWAIPRGPSVNPSDRRLAVHVEDHPVDYGSFEGTIPEGEYGGGNVIVWDRGRWIPEGDPEAAYAKGHLKFDLEGEKLHGGFSLVRMKGRGKADNWLLLKGRDEYADDDGEAPVRDCPESVISGLTVETIADRKSKTTPRKKASKASKTTKTASKTTPSKTASKATATITPELATLVDAVPTGPEWLHEIKYDGYRLIARLDGDDIRLLTRRGEDWSARFPWLAAALRKRIATPTAILDGELVHLGADGVTRFGELQHALSAGKHDALVYFAFDLLFLDGQDLRGSPLGQRKQALAELLPIQARPGRVRLSEHILGQGEPLFTRACRLGLEGVISKRIDAAYRSGRFRDWLKVKCGQRQEVVIGAFNPARSGGREIGALLLGVHNDVGELVYCGKVGTGFDFTGAADLRVRLDRLSTPRDPFTRRPPATLRTIFVRPELVAEVSFSNWTRDGRMRHPVFEGLREDKRAADVHRERPVPLPEPTADPPAKPGKQSPAPRRKPAANPAPTTILGTTLSHPDRVLFPADGITKRELAEYYAAVAPFILPWVTGRPLSILRCPDTIDKPCFFQKHIHHELPPGLRTADLDDGGAEAPYLYIEDARGLIGLTQVGTIELHIWGSTVARPDAPDRIVIDLDPDTAVPWARVKETALAVRDRLGDLGLLSFVKTTGGKGLHVVVPLTPGKQTWDQVKAFARGIALEFVRAAPKLFTATATKNLRSGKIYIDYLRNYRGSTSVAPFSVRARPGAPVSVPLAWDELKTLKSASRYTIKNLAARLSAQTNNVHGPWHDLPGTRQFLNARVLREVAAVRR